MFQWLQESVRADKDLHRDYTTSQLGLHDLLREWRAQMDAYSHEPGRYRYANHTRSARLPPRRSCAGLHVPKPPPSGSTAG